MGDPLRQLRGWSDLDCDPRAPAGAGGPGGFVPAPPWGGAGLGPWSPAARLAGGLPAATDQGARTWDWRAEGFLAPPLRVVCPHPVTVYRVWGGTASERGHPDRPGVCFSFEAPASRREAEALFAVWEWGNRCSHLTPFEADAGATLFIGLAHPGDAHDHGLGAPGSQVFIEAAEMRQHVHPRGAARPLVNDMGPHVVVPNRDPGQRRSS